MIAGIASAVNFGAGSFLVGGAGGVFPGRPGHFGTIAGPDTGFGMLLVTGAVALIDS